MFIKARILLIVIVLFYFPITGNSQQTDKIMIIIIDGARYTETLGDPTQIYTPKMWNLASQGTIIDNFKNDNYTFTSRAIPALWSGAWTDVQDTVYQGNSTQYSILPSLFEYYRKQKNKPADECFYVLKYIESLWLPSFDDDYGPDYWPQYHSTGDTDEDVANETQLVMDNYHPHFLWVYLADVDHAGHSGNWDEYTQAIRIADSIVDVLWQKIQSDPFYKDSTTLIVTNDHGRHDDENGGFQNHGCGCQGCRHIQFLAIGPEIKQNFVSYQYRYIPDMAVTASYLLGIEPEYSTGNIMYEIIDINTGNKKLNSISNQFVVYPNPAESEVFISYTLKESAFPQLTIYDEKGLEVCNLIDEYQNIGEYKFTWLGLKENGQKAAPGIYYFHLKAGSFQQTQKVLLLNN